jgi:hypothetical protein
VYPQLVAGFNCQGATSQNLNAQLRLAFYVDFFIGFFIGFAVFLSLF